MKKCIQLSLLLLGIIPKNTGTMERAPFSTESSTTHNNLPMEISRIIIMENNTFDAVATIYHEKDENQFKSTINLYKKGYSVSKNKIPPLLYNHEVLTMALHPLKNCLALCLYYKGAGDTCLYTIHNNAIKLMAQGTSQLFTKIFFQENSLYAYTKNNTPFLGNYTQKGDLTFIQLNQ